MVPTEEGVVPDFGRVRSLAICASDVDHLRIIGDYNDGEIKDLSRVSEKEIYFRFFGF